MTEFYFENKNEIYMLGVSTIMVMRDQLMLQYLSDLENSGIKNIEIDESLKRVGGTPDSGRIKPFDLNQIWCNIPFQSLSELKEYVILNGGKIQDNSYVSNFPIGHREIKKLHVSSLTTLESINLAYALRMKEMIHVQEPPYNIVEIAFQIKNTLKLPDELFIDFPIMPMDSNIQCGNPILSGFGIVKDIRLYHNLYGFFNARAIPFVSFPANFLIDKEVTSDSVSEKIANAFEMSMSEAHYGHYIEYRSAKNIKRKFLARAWKPVKSRMFTDQEIQMAINTGMFMESEQSLALKDDMNPEAFNSFIEMKSQKAQKYMDYWKSTMIF